MHNIYIAFISQTMPSYMHNMTTCMHNITLNMSHISMHLQYANTAYVHNMHAQHTHSMHNTSLCTLSTSYLVSNPDPSWRVEVESGHKTSPTSACITYYAVSRHACTTYPTCTHDILKCIQNMPYASIKST